MNKFRNSPYHTSLADVIAGKCPAPKRVGIKMKRILACLAYKGPSPIGAIQVVTIPRVSIIAIDRYRWMGNVDETGRTVHYMEACNPHSPFILGFDTMNHYLAVKRLIAGGYISAAQGARGTIVEITPRGAAVLAA